MCVENKSYLIECKDMIGLNCLNTHFCNLNLIWLKNELMIYPHIRGSRQSGANLHHSSSNIFDLEVDTQ